MTSTRQADGARLDALTSLRFVAAFLVVAYHVVFAFAIEETGLPLGFGDSNLIARVASSVLAKVAGMGSLGPNLFFVLSGFILYWAYLQTDRLATDGRASFYVARVARLYPVYLLGLLLALAAMLSGTTCPGASAECVAGRNPLSVIASVPMLQGWLPWSGGSLNGPAWTLSTELLFYATFPLIGPRIAKLSTRATWTTLGVSLLLTQAWLPLSLLVGPKPLVYDGSTPAQLWTLLHFGPPMHLAEFVAGIALGKLFVDGRLPTVSNERVQYAIVGCSLLSILVLSRALERLPAFDVSLAANDGLFDGWFCLIIVTLASGNRSMRRPQLVALGEASFSMYILHWPLWYLLRLVWPFGLGERLEFTVFAVCYVVVLIAASLASVKMLEEPARKRINARWRARQRALVPATRERLSSL